MCAIAGIYNFNQANLINEDLLRRMTQILTHRGPDNQGIFVDRNCGLGYRRLTIIDTTEQPQPILRNEDKSLRITFNGEIYNFPQLKKELLKKKHRFYTNTDTETLLHLYEEYGHNCVKKLNGMFAFAIWDARKNELFLARDHLGIKPLYYTQQQGSFYFASEIKAILQNPIIKREVDPISLQQFFHYRYSLPPRTMFRGIRQLLPGHRMIVSKKGVQIDQFWEIEYKIKNEKLKMKNERDKIQEVKSLLEEAIRMQLLADVPLGAFLSGGIDSSIVVGMMSQIMKEPVKTFNIGFSESKFDEMHYARQIAKRFGTDHHEVVVDADTIRSLPKIIYHLDEPVADPAAIPTFLLSQLAAKDVKVILTGEGGDELFAGYKEDFPSRLTRLWSILPPMAQEKLAHWVAKLPDITGKTPLYRSLLSPKERARNILWDLFRFEEVLPTKKAAENSSFPGGLKQSTEPGYSPVATIPQSTGFVNSQFNNEVVEVPGLAPGDPWVSNQGQHCATPTTLLSYAGDESLSTIYDSFDQAWEKTQVMDWDWLSTMLYLETKLWLPGDPLMKVDKMTMAHSLEARVPILDYRLVELAASIPSSLKMKDRTEKYVLRQAFADILPIDIFTRKKKAFDVPLEKWLRNELKPLLQEYLSEKSLESIQFLNFYRVESLMQQFTDGDNTYTNEIFAILWFVLWHKIYIEGENL